MPSPVTKRLAFGVTTVESDHFAELIALDQFAGFTWLLYLFTMLCMCSVPFVSLVLLELSCACMATAVVASLGLRVAVRLDPRTVKIVHTCFAIPYRRRQFDVATAAVSIEGTGDWGDPGGWPISELCQLGGRGPNGDTRTWIGPSHARGAIADFLRAQRVRLVEDLAS